MTTVLLKGFRDRKFLRVIYTALMYLPSRLKKSYCFAILIYVFLKNISYNEI